MKKTSIILLTLAMILMVFTVACGDDSKSPADKEAEDSRQLDDDGDDVEAARGSDTSGTFNFDNVTFDDWQKLAEPDDEASFRGSAIDDENLVKKDAN